MYKISPDGEILSYMIKGNPRPLKTFTLKSGYIATNLYPGHRNTYLSQKIIKQKIVAHLVLLTFGPPKPSPKHKVRYVDGDRSNINISNLVWATQKDISTILMTKIKDKMKRPRKQVIVVIDGMNTAGNLLNENISRIIDKNDKKKKKRDFMVFSPEGYDQWRTKGYIDPETTTAEYR